MRLLYRTAVLLSAALAVADLAGCSSGKGSAHPSPTHTTHSARATVSATVAAKTLLSSKDVGKTFKARRYAGTSTPLPCQPSSAPPLAKATSATVHVAEEYVSKKPAVSITEEIFVYPTPDAAKAASLVAQQGMECASGNIYNSDGSTTTVLVGPVHDISAQLTADSAYSWVTRSPKNYGGLAVVQNAGTLVLLRVSVDAGTNGKDVPDSVELARTAATKAGKL